MLADGVFCRNCYARRAYTNHSHSYLSIGSKLNTQQTLGGNSQNKNNFALLSYDTKPKTIVSSIQTQSVISSIILKWKACAKQICNSLQAAQAFRTSPFCCNVRHIYSHIYSKNLQSRFSYDSFLSCFSNIRA